MREYTEGLVRELKRTSLIAEFAKVLRAYMPKYNELKHFNANKIVLGFVGDGNKANNNSLTFY